jgi:hypothetical protein
MPNQMTIGSQVSQGSPSNSVSLAAKPGRFKAQTVLPRIHKIISISGEVSKIYDHVSTLDVVEAFQ